MPNINWLLRDVDPRMMQVLRGCAEANRLGAALIAQGHRFNSIVWGPTVTPTSRPQFHIIDGGKL